MALRLRLPLRLCPMLLPRREQPQHRRLVMRVRVRCSRPLLNLNTRSRQEVKLLQHPPVVVMRLLVVVMVLSPPRPRPSRRHNSPLSRPSRGTLSSAWSLCLSTSC